MAATIAAESVTAIANEAKTGKIDDPVQPSDLAQRVARLENPPEMAHTRDGMEELVSPAGVEPATP